MKLTDSDLREMAADYGSQKIEAMAKELLERREKEKAVPAKVSLKSPATDEQLEDYIEQGHKGYDDSLHSYSIRRELLEYRKRTRRTVYQKGDVLEIRKGDPEHVVGLVGASLEGRSYPVYIPLDSLKDLHQ